MSGQPKSRKASLADIADSVYRLENRKLTRLSGPQKFRSRPKLSLVPAPVSESEQNIDSRIESVTSRTGNVMAPQDQSCPPRGSFKEASR